MPKEYSLFGISTGGSAEIKMAAKCPKAIITATTIDEKGLALTRKEINKTEYKDRILCKIEDCGKPWQAKDDYFDFCYARLVLHYLTKDELSVALKEMRRTLKVGAKAFIVVRSVDEPELKVSQTFFDKTTGFIIYTAFTGEIMHRQFFTEGSLRKTLETAGFKTEYIRTIHEQCYGDYEREVKNPNLNILIETCVKKIN